MRTLLLGDIMSKSNKLSLICLSLVITALFTISTFVRFYSSKNEILSQNVANANYTEDSSKEEYVVKEYNKKVAVFKQGEKEPYEILDIDVTSLPMADREALKDGISFKDTKKLSKLIEDYDG